jgi:hypothetical protein
MLIITWQTTISIVTVLKIVHFMDILCSLNYYVIMDECKLLAKIHLSFLRPIFLKLDYTKVIILHIFYCTGTRQSVQRWATAGGPGFDSQQGQDTRTPQRPDRLWNPPSFLASAYICLFPGGKRPEREADHTSPSSATVKDDEAVPSFSQWRGA